MPIPAFIAASRNWLVEATPEQPRQWLILLGIIVAISIATIEAFIAINRPISVNSADQKPVVTISIPSDGNISWTTYKGHTDSFQINLPTTWHREINSGDDPDDEYNIDFSTKLNVVPELDPSEAKGTLAIGATEIGHGVPGPQVDSSNTSVGGRPALRTVWESATLRLVQYRWVWHSKNFLLQLESGTSQTTAFNSLDQIAKTIKLY